MLVAPSPRRPVRGSVWMPRPAGSDLHPGPLGWAIARRRNRTHFTQAFASTASYVPPAVSYRPVTAQRTAAEIRARLRGWVYRPIGPPQGPPSGGLPPGSVSRPVCSPRRLWPGRATVPRCQPGQPGTVRATAGIAGMLAPPAPARPGLRPAVPDAGQPGTVHAAAAVRPDGRSPPRDDYIGVRRTCPKGRPRDHRRRACRRGCPSVRRAS